MLRPLARPEKLLGSHQPGDDLAFPDVPDEPDDDDVDEMYDVSHCRS